MLQAFFGNENRQAVEEQEYYDAYGSYIHSPGNDFYVDFRSQH